MSKIKLLYSGYVGESEDYEDSDYIGLKDETDEHVLSSLLGDISNDLEENDIIKGPSYEESSCDCIVYDYIIPRVAVRIYVSDEKISYEEAVKNQILESIGEFVANETWNGYSEYTILGYDVNMFKLVGNNGEHDLTEILKSYIGKFIWFELEVL